MIFSCIDFVFRYNHIITCNHKSAQFPPVQIKTYIFLSHTSNLVKEAGAMASAYHRNVWLSVTRSPIYNVTIFFGEPQRITAMLSQQIFPRMMDGKCRLIFCGTNRNELQTLTDTIRMRWRDVVAYQVVLSRCRTKHNKSQRHTTTYQTELLAVYNDAVRIKTEETDV